MSLVLTVLWHPDVRQIGHQAFWPADAVDWRLQRFEPAFCAPGSVSGSPLGLQVISRQGLRLRRHDDGAVTLFSAQQRMRIEVDGVPMGGIEGRDGIGVPSEPGSSLLPDDTAGARLRLTADRLARGTVLGLGGTVLLCLHRSDRLPRREAPSGLVGVSSGMIRVREQIRQVAPTRLPVLLLAESGSGKELAANAIHGLSPAGGGPFVAINMATLGEHTAATELFGASRGAYTGAQTARRGLFAAAGEGSLFLDEVGDTPPSVQPMLLRVLDAGEYRPLGAIHIERSRARIIAATDRALGSGEFNQPLLRRLEAYTLRIPPLRERREDLGVLLMHLLPEPQAAIASRLGWSFLTTAFICDWPGNVRQMGQVLRRAAMQVAAGEAVDLSFAMAPGSPGAATTSRQGVPAGVRDALTAMETDAADRAPTTTGSSEAAADRARIPPAALSEDQVVAALDRHGWCVQRAARALCISRPSLYALIQRSSAIRDATEVPEPELRAAYSQGVGQAKPLEACATALKVPKQGLRRRLRSLGLLQGV
ncbi:sigma 54-interacting transcriptional regulator [Roseateles amylovorans]|uniref:Sigma 54-interacting transcriptional regulator n=1 Tax=Roseateles amylovorans TaxID=2978473 RepID=A0ABY6ASX8_9BURK|nr:sigma 54-interacting transcriptional regulator [Roseateles amylovorans]UXH76122.1 sigma 54-interacting transcriptional regulator [Roseateles amylovorans]